MKNVRASLVAVVAAASLAAATRVHAQMPPRPAPEIARITALAGAFEGEATLTAGGRTLRFTLHHDNHVIAGGFGLESIEQADVPGMGRYEAANLIGFDTGTKRLHLLTVSNDPYTHDHAGPWTDATHVTLRYEGMRDGKKLVEVIPMEVLNADEYRFRSTVTVPGAGPEVFVADMKRVKTASR